MQSHSKTSLTFLWAFGVLELFLCLFDFICKTREQSIFSTENSVALMQAGALAPKRRQHTLLMILGMLPTRLQQDEGLQMKNRYSSIAERALFHYGNYCNHEGGASLHALTITQPCSQAHPLKRRNRAVIYRLSLQIIKSIHEVGSHYPIEH